MQERELRSVPELQALPVFEEDDPNARDLASRSKALDIAEADDTRRLFELLRRNEYRALGVVRERNDPSRVRVYFERLDRSEVQAPPA